MIQATYPLVRRGLFAMDAEHAHERTIGLVAMAPGFWGALANLTLGPPDPSLKRRAFGVDLAGPIGLAAGLDKDGRAIRFWPSLGFGFVEVGTVTAHPQPGNDRPRLWRIPENRALVNRMGFNNRGSEALAATLRGLRESGRWPAVPVGANVGKSKVTPVEDAVGDYVTSVTRLRGLADWFTVNVSSPNTPGLRALQDKDMLAKLLPAVLDAANGTPVLLKLAPDLADEALVAAVELAIAVGIQGIVATNTTIRRDMLTTDPGHPGGLSGAPLWPIARDRIGVALKAAGGKMPIVGVGGISTVAQVRELMTAGCAAVQLYSALIYEGPGLPAGLNRELVEDHRRS
jgi:dihydroorotate dehydrogenase